MSQNQATIFLTQHCLPQLFKKITMAYFLTHGVYKLIII